jgi:DNA-binding MarR family transcriptional regulator
MDENQLYERFIKTCLLLSDGDRRFFQRYQLSQARFYALLHIHDEPGLSLTDLSQRLLCTKGNTTRILTSLERDGYLLRKLTAQDRRVYQIQLSESGRSLLQQVRSAYQAFNRERFRALTAEEIKGLTERMDHLNQDLESQLR